MITVVIPVFRSAAILPELYVRLETALRQLSTKFEVIFVEDCGGDNSWQTIKGLVKNHPEIRGIQMSRNYGQHNALLCGIREAQGDIIITMDDDLQHPPEELSKLLTYLENGYDVVYGPPEQEQHGFIRDLASRITKIALEDAMNATNASQVSALRVFRTELRNAFEDYRSPTVNIDVLLTWATTKFGAVRVRHDTRKIGQSGYTPRKLVRHALNMMTGFSPRPLQLASMMGIGVALLGMVLLSYVLIRWIIDGSVVPGFAFLASIIVIFSGAQLLALGIIGEYLSRMHFRMMERPPYVVRNRTI